MKKEKQREGWVYELGIPMMTDEAFPFIFNVKQKTPVAERRNELDSSYRAALMRGLLNDRLDLVDDEELAEEYVTQYLSKYTHKIRRNVQREYIRRRFETDPSDLLVSTAETPSIAVAWAVQQGLPQEKADDYSRNVRDILTEQCRSVQDWYTEMTDDRMITVIDVPGPDQDALLDYFDAELVDRSSARGVTFKLAFISGGTEDGQVHATYSPADEVIYLNALVDEWDVPSPRQIGTALHELEHHKSARVSYNSSHGVFLNQ